MFWVKYKKKHHKHQHNKQRHFKKKRCKLKNDKLLGTQPKNLKYWKYMLCKQKIYYKRPQNNHTIKATTKNLSNHISLKGEKLHYFMEMLRYTTTPTK